MHQALAAGVVSPSGLTFASHPHQHQHHQLRAHQHHCSCVSLRSGAPLVSRRPPASSGLLRPPGLARAASTRVIQPHTPQQPRHSDLPDRMVPAQEGAGVATPLPHMRECIYLDYNATTPIYPEVAAAMRPFAFECFGNPSSVHAYGQATKQAVDTARQQVAALINCWADELAFTSCGTESDNCAIWGTVMAAAAAARASSSQDGSKQQQGPPHVVTSAIEHPAITNCLQSLQQLGLCTYTAVPVSAEGLVAPGDVLAALTPSTVLVTIMHSNNEVGAIQPVGAITAAVKAAAPRVLVHTDAAQSMGRLDVDVKALGVDMLTLVGHKFGAPKGVAALFIKRGVKLVNLLSGGSQEAGRRGGTENVLLLVGLGAAAELAFSERAAQAAHMRAMRDRLAAGLLAAFPPELVRINGPADARLALPNTLSISIKGLAAASLLQMLHAQLAASAGAACHSSKGPAVSPVLHAMSLGPAWAVGTLRLSTGRHTTADEVDRAVQLIRDAAVRQGIIGEQQQQQPPQQPQQAGEGNGRIEGSVAQAAPAR